ncbi:MAG TPA: MMPL family transporter [Actinophytocola sp.]|uniref:MMPL family transporter n=1 Tax=Actinophytocola sp. TaxID=1872138 RepID=UPI002DDD78DF|nr:MMPL family transporter [Actinophytocola sp.]HEV2778135.1 MMPL family transporter [Actinophytocola sp.]
MFAVWLLLAMIGGSLAAKLGTVQNNEAQAWLPSDAESTQALQVAQDHFATRDLTTAVVVYARSSGLTEADRAAVSADASELASVSPTQIPPATFSPDGKAAFLTIGVRSSPSDNTVLGDAVERIKSTAQAGAPEGLQVGITGQAGNINDYIEVFDGIDSTLLFVTILIVAALLLLTYRSPTLWLVPLLSVFIASQVASAVVYLLAKGGLLVNGLSASVLTVLVLGVGTDYALLLVARYREELRRHEDRHEAMVIAMGRSLPAIAASAGTVIIATLFLVFGSMNSTQSLGPVAAIGVAVAFLAMTSLLPAFLVIMGRWVFWPRIPRFDPEAEFIPVEKEHRFWSKVAGAVGRRPRTIWIGTALTLVALAFGSLSLQSGQTQAEQFTKPTDSVVGQELLAQHFPAGSSVPADVYAQDGTADAVLAATKTVPGVTDARIVGSNDGWTHITAVLADAPDTEAARNTVGQLRTTLQGLPGPHALVGGQTAVMLDTADAQSTEEKVLIPIILVVVLLILIVLLRAVVAPIVLLLSVVLSFAAAFGTAALLFNAFGFPTIDRTLVVFGFLFLVALGVDYTIFLMSRVREETILRGPREGILTGLSVTGGVITSAGLILAACFSVLAVLPVVNSLHQGVLIGVGVLLDTFLIRSLLVPGLGLHIGPKLWWPARIGAPPHPIPHPQPAKSAAVGA